MIITSKLRKGSNVRISKFENSNSFVISMLKKRGFTLIELLVAMGITTLLMTPIVWMLINGFRYNAIVWEQLKTQTDGRRVLREVVDIVRKAEESSIGAYPIEKADANELIIFANMDNDSLRERVRFWLDGKTIKRNIIKPSGNPLSYSGAGATTEIAHDIDNIAQGISLFSYYDENYTGAESALAQPVDMTKVRIIKVDLELELDPTESPEPLRVESMVSVRNLKTN